MRMTKRVVVFYEMNMLGLLCSAVRAVAGRRNGPCLHGLRFPGAGSNRVFKTLSECPSQTADTPARFSCYRLRSRTVLNIYGQDANSFLQGIITNDMNLLAEGLQKALYAHMLNVKGRTLYDIIIYSFEPSEDLNGILLECDTSVVDAITQHLKMYKIRRRVNVSVCADLSLWALLPRSTQSPPPLPDVTTAGKALVLAEDPRTHLMGWRLVARSCEDPLDFIAACQKGDADEYHSHRYKIGLPEGVRDLPPGEALPLESNLVFMNGISFCKGCYLGQELTARTHHTGVVRKRLLPVQLSDPPGNLHPGAELQSPGGKPAGKHRAGIGQVGLSLVRMVHANEALEFASSHGRKVTVKASVPEWWPEDTKS